MTAFLLRTTVLPSEALTEDCAGTATFQLFSDGALVLLDEDLLLAAAPGDVVVCLLARPTRPPAWQQFIQEALVIPTFGTGAGQSLGVAIFTAVADPVDDVIRWIVWCFGSASRALRRGAVDPRFGLMVALNRIAGDHWSDLEKGERRRGWLRQLQYRTPAPYAQQTGHRAAHDIPVDGFRVNRMLDVISAVGGRTVGDNSTGHLFGGRPLRFRAELAEVPDLQELAERLIADYRLRHYQEQFPWVDHYVLVEEAARVDLLRRTLWENLVHDPIRVDVLLPDDVLDPDEDRAIQYILLPGEHKRSECRTVLTSDRLAKYVAQSADESVLDRDLRFMDTNNDLVVKTSIMDCLATEFEVDGQRYVAYDGDFYCVDAAFLDQVNAEVAQIELCSIEFPPYEGGREDTWNQAVAATNPSEFVCLDKQLIDLAGRTPFEACDLVTTGGAMVHAKRYGQTSKMAYVFTQAEHSYQLLVQEPEARRKLDDRIVASASTPETAVAVRESLAGLTRRPPNLEIVFALLGDWHQRSLTNLPLLSKISLLGAVQRLRLMGCRPTVALVGLASRS